jgi:hypothetical protein
MADKKVQWGQKAQDQQVPRPDPNEYVFQKREDEKTNAAAPPAGNANDESQQPKPTPPVEEPIVRITVDVRKSVHKQLQAICQAKDLKLAPFIRQLIERELKKSRNPQ